MGASATWRRRTCFDEFRRRDRRDHGCPAFVAEATSAEQVKAVGLYRYAREVKNGTLKKKGLATTYPPRCMFTP
jgi:hypothetical protein